MEWLRTLLSSIIFTMLLPFEWIPSCVAENCCTSKNQLKLEGEPKARSFNYSERGCLIRSAQANNAVSDEIEKGVAEEASTDNLQSTLTSSHRMHSGVVATHMKRLKRFFHSFHH